MSVLLMYFMWDERCTGSLLSQWQTDFYLGNNGTSLLCVVTSVGSDTYTLQWPSEGEQNQVWFSQKKDKHQQHVRAIREGWGLPSAYCTLNIIRLSNVYSKIFSSVSIRDPAGAILNQLQLWSGLALFVIVLSCIKNFPCPYYNIADIIHSSVWPYTQRRVQTWQLWRSRYVTVSLTMWFFSNEKPFVGHFIH